MSFIIETDQNNKTIKAIIQKPTFCGVYTHFDCFLYYADMLSLFNVPFVVDTFKGNFSEKWLSRKF